MIYIYISTLIFNPVPKKISFRFYWSNLKNNFLFNKVQKKIKKKLFQIKKIVLVKKIILAFTKFKEKFYQLNK